MARVIWNEEPGTTWVNNTGKVKYQMQVQFSNSCGVCIQFAGAISSYWPIPFHRGCRCQNVAIWPGEVSAPFVDYMAEIEALEPRQQAIAVGASNWKLIEAKTVKWADVVTPTRIRDLREVVSRNQLSIDQMTSVGVTSKVAERAHQSVNTPAHEVAAKTRAELVDRLRGVGLTNDQIKEGLTSRLAARVGIKQGPSGPSAMPVKPFTPVPLQPLKAILVGFGVFKEVPRPKVAAITSSLPDFAGDGDAAIAWVKRNFGDLADTLTEPEWNAIRSATLANGVQESVFKKLGIKPPKE